MSLNADVDVWSQLAYPVSLKPPIFPEKCTSAIAHNCPEDARYRARDAAGTSILNSAQGLSLSVFCNHGHLACRALFNHLRLGIPKPPSHLGLYILPCHGTVPTCCFLLATPKEPTAYLDKRRDGLLVFTGRFIARMECIGIAQRTDKINIRRPLFESIAAFQCGRQSASLSTRL